MTTWILSSGYGHHLVIWKAGVKTSTFSKSITTGIQALRQAFWPASIISVP